MYAASKKKKKVRRGHVYPCTASVAFLDKPQDPKTKNVQFSMGFEGILYGISQLWLHYSVFHVK